MLLPSYNILTTLSAIKEDKRRRESVSKFLVRQKRMLQGYWEKLAILKYQLENQLLKLESFEATDNLVKAFKLAESAAKTLKLGMKDMDEVLKNMEIRMDELEEINSYVQLLKGCMNEELDEEIKEWDNLRDEAEKMAKEEVCEKPEEKAEEKTEEKAETKAETKANIKDTVPKKKEEEKKEEEKKMIAQKG